MSLRARAWISLLVPPFTWFVFEQGLSALLHTDCTSWPAGVAWGAASLALCGWSLALSWRRLRYQGELADPWLTRIALAVAGIFALAIAFQTLAVLIVPACVR